MGQDFVKNFPDGVDSLEDADVTSRVFDLDSSNRIVTKEVVHSFATNKSTLSASSERLLVQDGPKMQFINQTFSTSSNSNKNLSSQQGHKINKIRKSDTLQRESLRFMKGVMDECTHVANFSGMYFFVLMCSLENWINTRGGKCLRSPFCRPTGILAEIWKYLEVYSVIYIYHPIA